jgi:hypothetical protein
MRNASRLAGQRSSLPSVMTMLRPLETWINTERRQLSSTAVVCEPSHGETTSYLPATGKRGASGSGSNRMLAERCCRSPTLRRDRVTAASSQVASRILLLEFLFGLKQVRGILRINQGKSNRRPLPFKNPSRALPKTIFPKLSEKPDHLQKSYRGHSQPKVPAVSRA